MKSQITEFEKWEKNLNEKEPVPIFKKRTDKGFRVNENLADSIGNTLNKIKGRIDQELGESGDLDEEEYLDYRTERKLGFMKNLEIFNEADEKNGLDVVFLVDCSGSMRGLEQKMADITATIMLGLKKCPFVNFQTLAYSASGYEYQGYYDLITDYTEAGRIHADEDNYHDVHHLAISEAREMLESSDSKRLIIFMTDGHPEGRFEGMSIPKENLWSRIEKEITKSKNKGIDFFAIYYDHIGHGASDRMKKCFRESLYTTSDFSDIQTKLVEKLNQTVEKMNSGVNT